MRRILTSSLSLLFLCSIALPAAGQDRSWSVSVVTEAGGMIPLRTLGKNSGDFQQLAQQQVLSDLDDVPLFGGGIEVLFPGQSLRVRAIYTTTSGGGVSGRIAFCGDPDNPLITGSLCEPIVTDARVDAFSADLSFVRGALDARFRPLVLLGIGVRKYTLGDPVCPPQSPTSYRWRSCELLEELWLEEGGLAPTLRFGFGFDFNLGPVELRTSILDNVSKYPGGMGTADGHTQNDLTLTGGVSVKVF